MRILLIVLLMMISAEGHNQVFKCVKDGKMSYRDSPCDPTSTTSKVITARNADKSPILWSGLKFGMTVDEIKRSVHNTEAGSEDRLFNGATELLSVKGTAVAGITFDAGFFFQAGKFTQVNLSGSMMISNDENLSNFDRIANDFRRKYGQEGSHTIKNERFGLSAKAEWVNENGKIWVNITPTTARTSMLHLGYVPTRTSIQ